MNVCYLGDIEVDDCDFDCFPISQEIALGKRVSFYRLGKELGAGNFSKVKLGVHVLTKGKHTEEV